MNHWVKRGFKNVATVGKKAASTVITANHATAQSSLRAVGFLAQKGQGIAISAASSAKNVVATKNSADLIQTATAVATSGPVREMAKMCGRAGFAGAVVDGAMGGVQAARGVHQGKISPRQAAVHVGAEAGCGFVTSTSGTAGTLLAYMVTGTMGPAVLVAGMGASLGSRAVYRHFVGETLPDDDDKSAQKDDSEILEEIGPKPQM